MVVIERPIPTVTEIKIEATPDQELLNRTAELLEKEGWVKGHFQTSEGYCLIGGLRSAAGWDAIDESPWEDPAYRGAISRLGKVLNVGKCDDTCNCVDCLESPLIDWNDSQDSKEFVLNALREAVLV